MKDVKDFLYCLHKEKKVAIVNNRKNPSHPSRFPLNPSTHNRYSREGSLAILHDPSQIRAREGCEGLFDKVSRQFWGIREGCERLFDKVYQRRRSTL